MSQSASQAAVFYRDVAAGRRVWTVKDDGGFPAPKTSGGERVQPFWSSLSRVERIIKTVPAYAGFRPALASWEEFRDRWIPGLTKDGLKIGVNWSGARATGYDVEPATVQRAVEIQMEIIENAV
ncbi:MAG: DUF2750 domain-containing protein [Chthoniobacteraceae bacterium]